jgi:two-component system sensor histidine kinase/response regulator
VETEKGRSIVIVDDSKDDLLLILRALKECKIRNPIVSFPNGRDCLSALKQKEQNPLLILLDVVMPGFSGLELLAALQEFPADSRPPVVLLSSLLDLKNIHRGYQLGARTFLVKPVTREDILHLIGSMRELWVEDLKDGYLLRSPANLNPPAQGDTTFFDRRRGEQPISL